MNQSIISEWMEILTKNTIVIKFFIHKNIYVICSMEFGLMLDGILIVIIIDITMCT